MAQESVRTWQDVYDLIIATCQHDPEFHARGASALRFLNAAEAQAIEARRAETAKTGSVEDESAAPKGCVQ